jgi:hypothetical protein
MSCAEAAACPVEEDALDLGLLNGGQVRVQFATSCGCEHIELFGPIELETGHAACDLRGNKTAHSDFLVVWIASLDKRRDAFGEIRVTRAKCLVAILDRYDRLEP